MRDKVPRDGRDRPGKTRFAVDSPVPTGYRIMSIGTDPAPGHGTIKVRRKETAAVMGDAPFAAIERKINELVGMVAALRKEKEDLSAAVARKSAEAKELEQRVAELTKERNEIRNRVETILSRLESIEL